MFYNNSIHSTTGCKPVDFHNGKVRLEDYPKIREIMVKAKEKSISKLNENRENCELQTGPVFLKHERGGKNHARFRKVTVDRFDDDHLVTQTRHKYYKSHIKRKKRSQINE